MPSVESEPMRVRTLGERSEEKGLEGGLGGKEGRRFAMAPAVERCRGQKAEGRKYMVERSEKQTSALFLIPFSVLFCFLNILLHI